MAFNKAGLADYVEQNKDQILSAIVLGGKTIGRMTKQTGVKTSEKINYLGLEPVFQDGSNCGFTPQGDVVLTQREIATGAIKVNMELCDRTLLGKYAEYLVRVAADDEKLPFEAEIVSLLTDKINEAMEKAVWQGDTASENDNLKHFDGLLKIAGAEASVVDVSATASEGAYGAIKKMYMALPEELLEAGASIFVSPEAYREFIQGLVDKNNYHYSAPQNSNPDEYFFPGTNVKVVKTLGLAGTKKMVATYDANLYYGCDLENAKEIVKVWFSDDDDKFKIKVLWNAGVQFAFPNHVVLGTIA